MTAMNYHIVPKALSRVAVLLVLLVGFAGASDLAEQSKGSASSQKPKRPITARSKGAALSQKPKQPITADCLKALQAADSFLCAWVDRNDRGIKLVTDRLKKEINDDSWLRQYMVGLSNPRHQAFEIRGACESSSAPYSFAVTLYELAYGEAEGDSYEGTITLVKEGGVWRVDRLPPSSEE